MAVEMEQDPTGSCSDFLILARDGTINDLGDLFQSRPAGRDF